METTYLLDNFVSTTPGEPYRLFPFGVIVKGGKRRTITPEYAASFKLPHFKPPVKLGSHEEATPAGGHIVGLEVREDGLYAIPEFTDKGMKSITEGDYRYHSPEVLWDDGGIENPTTGEIIHGPLIWGDALLHTPHLGESAALYSVEQLDKESTMTEENVSIPKGLFEKFMASLFPPKPEPEPAPEPPAPEVPDEFRAAVTERDQFKAELEQLKAEGAKKARVDGFAAQLKETKVGEGAEMLAAMTDEQAAWVVQQFKALSAQIDESHLTTETGTAAPAPSDPKAALSAAITAYMAEHKVEYVQAFAALAADQPDLFKALKEK